MALELKKQTVETESVVCAPKAQLNIQAEAMVSGAGRDAVEILMEDAAANITGTEVQNGRLVLDGVVVCQAAYRQGDGDIIRAVEARAPLQHAFEEDAVGIGMNASMEACVTHVESGYLNGRILFHVTVELSGTVSKISATDVITDIGGVSGVQSATEDVQSVRYGAEAVAQVPVSETLALPQELGTQATLMDFATVTVEKVERDLGGVTVSGRVNAEVMIAGSIPGRPVAMVKYPMAFRQLVEMPEWLTENVQGTAAVNGIRSTLVDTGNSGEMGLRLDADVTVRVRAVQRQEVSCVSNAYAVGDSDLAVEQQPLRYLTKIHADTADEMFRGTLLIPENMSQVGSVLAAHARPAVTDSFTEKGSGVVEGVLEIAVMYMPSGGERPLTVRDELPFRISFAKPIDGGTAVAAEVVSCEASALMADRMEIRCGLRFRFRTMEEKQADVAVAAQQVEAEPRRPGIVMYWPGKDDTLWSVGRRYHVAVEDVKRENGGGETIKAGKALILRI